MLARRVGLILFAMVLLACGGGSKSASPTSTSAAPAAGQSTGSSGPDDNADSSLSSASIDPSSPCALVSIDDIKAAIGDAAVPTNSGPHCQWQTPDGKEVDLDITDFNTTGYKTVDEYRTGRTDPPFLTLPSPPDAFFDELMSEVTFPKGAKFVDLKITLDGGSQDFDQTTDKAAEIAALQKLADTVNAELT
jgi:hypothetical protein